MDPPRPIAGLVRPGMPLEARWPTAATDCAYAVVVFVAFEAFPTCRICVDSACALGILDKLLMATKLYMPIHETHVTIHMSPQAKKGDLSLSKT